MRSVAAVDDVVDLIAQPPWWQIPRSLQLPFASELIARPPVIGGKGKSLWICRHSPHGVALSCLHGLLNRFELLFQFISMCTNRCPLNRVFTGHVQAPAMGDSRGASRLVGVLRREDHVSGQGLSNGVTALTRQ